jgi:siroheme synthase-like protein
MGSRSFGYPVFLDLGDVPVLLVGGGPVALRKAEGLRAAGAAVTVVAPQVVAELEDVAARIERRAYVAGDVAGHRLVITATNDPAVNARVGADARAAGIWVNSADDPDNCSFILPAVARRGPVTVAVSTGGASPALASRLRRDIAATVLTPAVEHAAAELTRQRAEIHAAGGSTEDVDWTGRVEAALRGDPPPTTSG